VLESAAKLKRFAKFSYSFLPFKPQIFKLLRYVWRPPESIYKHLHFRGKFRVNAGSSSFVMQHYGFSLENDLFWNRLGFESSSLNLWKALCEKAKVIVDVGANTGVYALSAQCVNPAATVIAFEPVQRVFEKLKLNCQLNNYPITCIDKAASDVTGEATIYDQDSEHTYSVTVNKNMGENTFAVPIRTIRIDDFFAQWPNLKPDLLKIDVETHEASVLRGLGGLLANRPTMIIEILNDEVGSECERLLQGLRYKFFRLSDKAVEVDKLLGGYAQNYLLLPSA